MNILKRGHRSFRTARCLVAALCVAGAARVPARAAEDWKGASSPGAANVVENLSVQSAGKYTKVIIQSSAPLKYREIQQDNPPALFLYMSASTVSKRPVIQKIYGDLMEEVRFGYKEPGANPEERALELDYILFKLTEPASYKIVQKDWVLVVELQPRDTRAPKNNAPAPPDANDTYVPETLSTQKVKNMSVLPAQPTLQDFLDVGLANHVPLKLAEAEYKLSRMRFFEASRALFPSVSARYEESEGALLLDPTDPSDDTNFRRKQIGLQLGQPIFQSGRLYYSLRQASMQKRIQAQNLKKVRADVTFEIKRAYYNFIRSLHSLQARRDLNDRGSKVAELTRKKKQLEIVTEAEALGVESQYGQVYYRMLSDEKDLELAKLKLQSLLNTPEAVPAEVPDPVAFDPKNVVEIKTPLATLVEQARQNRPEMIIADYTARFQAYGEGAAKAENRLRIDASGFVGKSGAAFEEEPFQMHSAWNVGLQASMFFAGNSLRGNGSSEKTSPDLGETSRTETRAKSANLGILDGLKGLSDRRQASINKERAQMEREQTRRNVEVEVREAYFNLEKAKLQMKGAQQEFDYRQKDVTIARQKERMNLIDPSQALAAESSFAESVINFEEAIAFYKISLASLEKSMGLPLDSFVEAP